VFNFLRTPSGPVHPAVKVAGAGVTAGAAIAIAALFIAPFEGYASRPYVDSVGTGQPITWCYGRTAADGRVPPLSQVFTKQECTAQLEEDLTKKYDPEVRRCIHVPLPPHREAALVSFVYNLGSGALCNGPVSRYLNAGNVTAGCNAILAYDHAAGRRLPGLTRRRQAERQLCLRGD
jgi:lysozyme